MKNIFKLFLTLMMICGLCACRSAQDKTAAGIDASQLSGKYKLVEMTDENGTDITEDILLLEDHGMIVTLALNEDGSGQFDMFGELSDITWTESAILMNGEEVAMAYADGVLTLTNMSGKPNTMKFNRVKND